MPGSINESLLPNLGYLVGSGIRFPQHDIYPIRSRAVPLTYRTKIIVMLAFCLPGVGCTRRDFLTRHLAADLIDDSESFKQTQQFLLRNGVVSNKDYLSPEYLVLQRRGWITAVSVPCTAEIAPSPCWDVALTPIGVDIFRGLIPAGATSQQYFSIATARRELVMVTGISRSGNLAEVDFTWKWEPINEVGAALMPTGIHFKASVGFKHYDDGWRVIESAATNRDQGMEEALRYSQPAP